MSKAAWRIVCGSYDRLLYGADLMVDTEEVANNRSNNAVNNTSNNNTDTSSKKKGQKKRALETNGEAENSKKTKAVKYHLKELKQVFGYASHISCIKAVAIGGSVLASGSTDEIIKLYDIQKRVELGSLLHHDGSITTLQFFETSYLLSGSEDNTICIWRLSDWECLHQMKGHKGPINSIAIHPSGRLALSTARDKTLRLWNLMNGKCSYTKTLSKNAENVAWSGSGDMFAISMDKQLDIFSTEKTNLLHTINTQSYITLFQFVDSNYVFIGQDNGEIRIYSLDDISSPIAVLKSEQNRIRGLHVVKMDDVDDSLLVCSASSNGWICAWKLPFAKEKLTGLQDADAPKPILTLNAGIRLTCAVVTMLD